MEYVNFLQTNSLSAQSKNATIKISKISEAVWPAKTGILTF